MHLTDAKKLPYIEDLCTGTYDTGRHFLHSCHTLLDWPVQMHCSVGTAGSP